MTDDVWAGVADAFVEGAYATVKGRVRTYVMHHHLLTHLPSPPARVLDVGGGAGNQSFPLARAGYDVTLIDPSPAMLAKAERRRAAEPEDVRERIRLLEGRGEEATQLTEGAAFDAVLCHGVLMYVADPAPVIAALVACTAPGGLISILALNAKTLSVRPALEQRWDEALAAFDASGEVGVLGVDTRADTVDALTESLAAYRATAINAYGVWLFSDWMDLDATGDVDVAGVAAVELAASRREPYASMSRVFHLIARKDRA